MASTKNVQALNSRLELACQTRVSDFYRQHVSSLADLDHQKLETARLLKAVKKCPSDHEALSIKFLGPPPKSGLRRRGRQQQHQQQHQPRPDPLLDDPSTRGHTPHLPPRPPRGGVTQSARNSARREQQQHQHNDDEDEQLAQILQRELYQFQQQQQQQQPPLTAANPFARSGEAAPAPPPHRSKTFVEGFGQRLEQDRRSSRNSRSRSRRHRRLADKLERFYAHLAATKLGCGLPVVDASQTEEARRFGGTLSRAEWRSRLAKLDPEYFKNMVDSDTCSSCSSGGSDAGSDFDGDSGGDASERGSAEEES